MEKIFLFFLSGYFRSHTSRRNMVIWPNPSAGQPNQIGTYSSPKQKKYVPKIGTTSFVGLWPNIEPFFVKRRRWPNIKPAISHPVFAWQGKSQLHCVTKCNKSKDSHGSCTTDIVLPILHNLRHQKHEYKYMGIDTPTPTPWKHGEFTQCCFNVGPPSSTLVQHWNSTGWMPRVCWAPTPCPTPNLVPRVKFTENNINRFCFTCTWSTCSL